MCRFRIVIYLTTLSLSLCFSLSLYKCIYFARVTRRPTNNNNNNKDDDDAHLMSFRREKPFIKFRATYTPGRTAAAAV